MADEQPIARVPFVDRALPVVYPDKNDRQFVVDDGRDTVYGYWVLMDDPDEPATVDVE
jgi:hypothetical protein